MRTRRIRIFKGVSCFTERRLVLSGSVSCRSNTVCSSFIVSIFGGIGPVLPPLTRSSQFDGKLKSAAELKPGQVVTGWGVYYSSLIPLRPTCVCYLWSQTSQTLMFTLYKSCVILTLLTNNNGLKRVVKPGPVWTSRLHSRNNAQSLNESQGVWHLETFDSLRTFLEDYCANFSKDFEKNKLS